MLDVEEWGFVYYLVYTYFQINMDRWFTIHVLGYDALFSYDLVEVTFSDALICLMTWTFLFTFVHNLWEVSGSWRDGLCRMLLITNITQLLSVSYLVRRTKEAANTGTEKPNDETLLLLLTLGYILFDYIWYEDWPESLLEIPGVVYHLFSALTVILTIASGSTAAVAIAAIVIFELTDPWVQISWWMSALKNKNHVPWKIVEMAFIKIFFLCRLAYILFFTISVCSISGTGLHIKVCTVVLQLISWYQLTLEKEHVHDSDSDSDNSDDSDSDDSDTDDFVNEAVIQNIGH